MNKSDLIEKLDKYNKHITRPEYFYIDPAIQPLIDWCRNQGFVTFASCSSHIRDKTNKQIDHFQAYVAFWYADEDKYKVDQLRSYKFPRSKYFRIVIDDEFGENENACALNIFFNTRYNRIYHLKRIYKNLGIEVKDKLYLEKERW
jgi:hypothetical protein